MAFIDPIADLCRSEFWTRLTSAWEWTLRRIALLTSAFMILAMMVGEPAAVCAHTEEEPGGRLPVSERFTHLTVSDGLSHNTITALLQDRRGFVWIGTQDGLTRFDGYEFVIYRYEPDNPNSLSYNHVRALVEDTTGALWIATHGGGLTRFDPETATFTRYQHVPGDPTSLGADDLFALHQDQAGHLWIGGTPSIGLDRLDASQVIALSAGAEISPTFYHYGLSSFIDTVSSGLSAPDPFRGGVQAMMEDGAGDLWMTADLALVRFDAGTETMDAFYPPTGERLLRTIAQDASGNLWMGGLEGLYKFDPMTERFTRYDLGFGISTLIMDGETLWVGGLGIHTFDLRSERVTRHYTHQEADPNSLIGDRATAMMKDAGGVLWVGTTQGISLMDPRQRQFSHYRSDPGDFNDQGDDQIQAVAGGVDGSVWLAKPQVIERLNPFTGEVQRYYPESRDSTFPGPGLASLCIDRQDNVWAGAGDRLYHLDVANGTFERYDDLRAYAREGPPPSIPAIVADVRGDIWIAMTLVGLHRLDRETGMFHTYLPHDTMKTSDPQTLASDRLSALSVGRTGDLWIGYRDGLVSRLDASGAFVHYAPDAPEEMPSFGWIEAIHETEAGTLWLATRSGLVRFDPQAAVTETERGVLVGPIRRYDENDGLPVTTIHSILVEDGDPITLWLGTANGLSRFDPRTETFYNFDEADGIGGQLFNAGATWKAPDGRMYFGGREGLTAFYPDRITLSTYEPRVVLTELRLANQPVAVGGDSVLTRPIWDTQHLTLRHDDDIVSLAFAALDYAAPHKLGYRYQLEGLEKDWVMGDSEHRFATYTHLPAGEYTFRVQGTNASGVWSSQEVSLALTVLPPWWETWWFRSGALLLIMGAVVAGVRWRIRDLEQRSRALEIEVAERTQELAARTERLQESEKRFREMTELLPGAVVELDPKFTITYVNRSGLSLFGYTETDVDRGLNAMDLLRPTARERAAQRIAQHMAGKALSPTEYRIQKKDGTEMPVLLKAAPIQQSGELKGFRASITDISELKDAQHELAEALEAARHLQDKAEAANQAKSTFLANMSHELRTPLNAILGYAQLMARDTQATATQRENLEIVIRSGEHLLNLISGILALSKIEAGRATFQESAFDLYRQLHSLQEMFQLRADDKRLTLHLEIAPDVPRYVITDEGKLRQVLINLLSNAVKFTDEGGVALRVGGQRQTSDHPQPLTCPLSRPTDYLLRIEVEDSGVGIAPEEMEALFDPFIQTASGQRSQVGTGLGLPISRQFVSLMGGYLSVKSAVGQGTLFRVALPIALADADQVEALEVEPRRRIIGVEPGQTAPDGGSFRLLIVEDRATNRDLLLKLLRPLGFALRTAVNGAEGVALWKTWRPHLVWMDMRMPVMDGYAATREIKTLAAVEGRSTLVIALTASSFEEDRRAILAAGCDDFIRKPYREREIFDVLHQHLGIRFIYEVESATAVARDDPVSCSSWDALQATVAKMPKPWTHDLYEAAAALDADQMLALIEAVHSQAPEVADTLTRWVHDYEYDKIIALLEPEG